VRVGVNADVGRNPSARCTISAGPSFVARAARRAAARANEPPEPIASTPSSGSISSPEPLMTKTMLLVRHDEQCLEPPQHAVRPPVLGQLDRGARQVGRIALQLLLELLDNVKASAAAPAKPARILPPRSVRTLLALASSPSHDRDLPSPPIADFAVAADAENRRAMDDWQHAFRYALGCAW